MEISVTKESITEKIVALQYKLISMIGIEPYMVVIYKIISSISAEINAVFKKLETYIPDHEPVARHVRCINIYFMEKIQLPYEDYLLSQSKKKIEANLKSFRIKTLIYVVSKVCKNKIGSSSFP